MNLEQQPEQQKEMFLEHLRDEIGQVALEMGVELTAEELQVAWQGSTTDEEKDIRKAA